MDNPIVRTSKPKKEPYPITVYCIVEDLSYINLDILKIREYAHKMNINFVTREYNSLKYSDDRNYVYRLPAFHIYDNSSYKTTFYIHTRPYQIIQDTTEAYKHRILLHQTRKEAWKQFFSNIIISLKKMTHRKTRMEKYIEEKKKEEKKGIYIRTLDNNWS